MNEQLLKDFKHFEYTTADRVDMIEQLLKKGYSEKEIIDTYNAYSFRKTYNGQLLLGILMILLAGLMAYSINSTLGSFQYEFNSSGDFFRLNEWVLKPFLMWCFIILGINMLVNRGYFSKNVKTLMICFCSLLIVSAITANSVLTLFSGVCGLVLSIVLKKPENKILSEPEMLLASVKYNQPVKKKALKQINVKHWKGSGIFIILILLTILYLNSTIHIIGRESNETGLLALTQSFEPTAFEMILSNGLRVLYLGCFLTAILVNINIHKFKYVLAGLMVIALVHIVLGLIHQNFQISIIPSLILIGSGLITFYHRNIFIGKKARS